MNGQEKTESESYKITVPRGKYECYIFDGAIGRQINGTLEYHQQFHIIVLTKRQECTLQPQYEESRFYRNRNSVMG